MVLSQSCNSFLLPVNLADDCPVRSRTPSYDRQSCWQGRLLECGDSLVETQVAKESAKTCP